MEDYLKEYIQRSRQDLDKELPRKELFAEIMNQMESGNARQQSFTRKFTVRRLAIAASLLTVTFLFVAYLAIQKRETPDLANVSQQIESDQVGNTGPDATEETIEIGKLPKQETKDPLRSEPHTMPQSSHSVPHPVFASEPKVANMDHEQSNEQSFVAAENTSPLDQELVSAKGQPFELHNQNSITTADSIENSISEHPIAMEDKAPVSEEHAVSPTQENQPPEAQSVGSFLKKGFLKFLSKKTKEWTSNTIDFQTGNRGHESALAVNVKTELLEFSKTFHFGTNDH